MKIIFLDFDGVVNNLVFHDINGEPTFYNKEWELGTETTLDKQYVNDFQAVAWLNKICREFNCSIVVTSSWRGPDQYKEFLYRAGLNKNIQILGKTPSLSIHVEHETRGREIMQWLNDNQDLDIEDFIILDDDTDMWILSDHLIKTDTIRGLGYYEYEKICKRWEKNDE